MELLAEVLHHVVPLGFTVNKKVKTDLLLEADNKFDFLLDEIFVLFGGELSLAELGTSLANLLGLLR